MDQVCLPAASLEIHQKKHFGQKDSPEPGAQTVSQRLQEIFCNVVLTFYRRPENFHAWCRTESPDAQLSCSSPGLAAEPILTQPAAQGDITS